MLCVYFDIRKYNVFREMIMLCIIIIFLRAICFGFLIYNQSLIIKIGSKIILHFIHTKTIQINSKK
jgi:phosphate/sulfate permease